LPPPQPESQGQPRQESGTRPARALPYAIDVAGTVQDGGFLLEIINQGRTGVALAVRTLGGGGPWFYTVESGKRLDDRLPLGAGYNFEVHGPNGFLRGFLDTAPYTSIVAESRYDGSIGALVITARNFGRETLAFETRALNYAKSGPRHHRLAPGEALEDRWPISANSHWYDIVLEAGDFVRRWAGHIETGNVSHSDPAIGMT